MKQLFDGMLHTDYDFDLNGRSRLSGNKLVGDKLKSYLSRQAKKVIPIVKSNNKKGYNKHKTNPNPVKILTVKEKMDLLSVTERMALAYELAQASMKFRRLANSCQARYNYLMNCKESSKVDDISNEDIIKMSNNI